LQPTWAYWLKLDWVDGAASTVPHPPPPLLHAFSAENVPDELNKRLVPPTATTLGDVAGYSTAPPVSPVATK
jgi:hypothetical protein